MTRTQRGAFAACAALIALIAIALIAGGSGGSAAPAPAAPALSVVGGKPSGGAQVLEYRRGDHVELSVSSDTADQLHVHGYDLREALRVGSVTRLGFEAALEGEFRIELEHAKQAIAVLRVRP
jgi:hypothetical protein